MKIEIQKNIIDTLTNNNWKFTINEDQTISLAFIGAKSNSKIPIVLIISDHWVSLTGYMLLNIPNDDLLNEISKKLCEWNYQTKVLKFAISPEKVIILGSELPISDFSLSLFNTSLDLLCYYADYAYPHLINMWHYNGDN